MKPSPCKYCGMLPAFITGMGAPFYSCINKDCCPTYDDVALEKWNNTRAQPKYKRVDLDGYSILPRDEEKYEDLVGRIIDDIKSKYGDLYTIERTKNE